MTLSTKYLGKSCIMVQEGHAEFLVSPVVEAKDFRDLGPKAQDWGTLRTCRLFGCSNVLI